VTVSVVRQMVAELLRGSPVAQVAERASQVLRRTEEARIYHWVKATGDFPPPRPRPPAPPPR
jgi:hypothetical protein